MADEEIKKIVNLTIQELKKNGLLKDYNNAAYSDVSELIYSFYANDKKDPAMSYAIQGLRFDPYYRILKLYFKEHLTVEAISEELGVDRSTVLRNKKRLCMAIYTEII